MFIQHALKIKITGLLDILSFLEFHFQSGSNTQAYRAGLQAHRSFKFEEQWNAKLLRAVEGNVTTRKASKPA